jgi:3-phenylpropionate/trans-cinnamate dioxygenase ferredoxin reductase subunit
VAAAEDYFDIDDDGVVIVLTADVPESERARVEEAARTCPVSALRVED